jgi:hypothetical protein
MKSIGPFRFPFIAPSLIRMSLRPTIPLADPFYAECYRKRQHYVALTMPARWRV